MKFFLSIVLFLITSACKAQIRTLDFFISQAAQNSPVLKDLQNQILISRIDSQLLRATLRTQVNFLSTNSIAPNIHGWGYDPAITNYANVSAIFQANRNFITTNNLSAQLRTLDLQRRSLLDTIQLSQRDLVRVITDQYITTYGDQLDVAFTKEVFELLKGEDEMLKKLAQASVFKQTDYLNFYVTLQQQELVYLQAQNQYAADYLTLNYLAGIVDTSVQQLEKPDLAEVVQENLSNSVFLHRFATDSLRLANEKELINFQYKPRVGAYVDGGYNSSLQFQPQKNFGFSAGLSLTVPIYDGHQKQLRMSQVDIRERTRQTNRQYFLAQYNQQVSQLRLQLRSLDVMVDKINKQIEYSHTLILANNKLLQTGDITIRDYIIPISNYLNARNLLTMNRISRLRIVNEINYWNR